MITTPIEDIKDIVAAQRAFFRGHATRSVEFRLEMLKRLRASIVKYERELAEALYNDLHKSYEEAYLTEISIVLAEIDNFLKHLKGGAGPSNKSTPLKMFPSHS